MFEQDMENALDNQKLKEEWVAALLGLMRQLKEWTVEQIKVWQAEAGDRVIPNVIELTTERNEQYIGRYYAPMLVITAENCLVEILPAGRFAIGAIGRVDMMSGRRSYSFLYSRRKGWVCMENRRPLTKELYLELLNQLA